ncbi:hypothetical protein [Psychrobacter sp. FDAARGOS_221]|uniref:hypothetical protein n=1 Tax=Psychrobacter sp. FDAARGOS_221 TaxID=1975705 RepID=UPI000BB5663F|nr:hypothetical protein [Psychrobacter sp. FDAARGOS_221]PNK59542.1 hypothetical protein A6J60_000670 [Psychrobacter sp. FDAARGOS_221]
MTHIADKLDKASSLIEISEFSSAFNLLNEIIIDAEANKEEVADAINLKGLIVAMYCPNITEYDEDETGLKYFIKAFDYNPYELGVLFNILSSFDDLDMRQAYTRNNKHMFIRAYEILKNELFDSLDDEMKEQLVNQTNQYHEFKKQLSAKPS